MVVGDSFSRRQTLVDLPVGPPNSRLAHAVIETPCGSSNKYEYDPELGLFRLDRVLANSVHFPGDYGFVPSTVAEDGEPLDILLVATGPSVPGMLIVARPIGVAEVLDAGENDAKIIAVAHGEPRHSNVREIADIGTHRIREIEHFFAIYKSLADDRIDDQSVLGWRSAAEAHRRIEQAHARYRSLVAAR